MIYLGADHNGYFLKEKIKRYLVKHSFSWKDCGAFTFRKSDDYVDYSTKVGRKLRAGDIGILVCGSGHGMVIAANKLAGIRAIMPLDPRSARDGRHDDHANIIVLSAWEVSIAQVSSILTAFFATKTGTAPRYLRRLRKVKALER